MNFRDGSGNQPDEVPANCLMQGATLFDLDPSDPFWGEMANQPFGPTKSGSVELTELIPVATGETSPGPGWTENDGPGTSKGTLTEVTEAKPAEVGEINLEPVWVENVEQGLYEFEHIQNINTWRNSIQSDIKDIKEQLVALRTGLIIDFGKVNEKMDEVLTHVSGPDIKCVKCGELAVAFACCGSKCYVCQACITSARQGSTTNRKRNFCPSCEIPITQFRYIPKITKKSL